MIPTDVLLRRCSCWQAWPSGTHQNSSSHSRQRPGISWYPARKKGEISKYVCIYVCVFHKTTQGPLFIFHNLTRFARERSRAMREGVTPSFISWNRSHVTRDIVVSGWILLNIYSTHITIKHRYENKYNKFFAMVTSLGMIFDPRYFSILI